MSITEPARGADVALVDGEVVVTRAANFVGISTFQLC
jgi:hypothetical protein